MSGNPFRRQLKATAHPACSEVADNAPRLGPTDTLTDDAVREGKRERTQDSSSTDWIEELIQSEALSNGTAGHVPAYTTGTEDPRSSTTKPASHESGQAVENTRQDPSPISGLFVQQSGVRAPFNPFRTSATTEAASSFGHARGRKVAFESANGGAQAWLDGNRPDIDAAKGSLNRGTATPPPLYPQQQHQQQTPQDSSSSVDTSSISRQSIFDHVMEAHPESPRTSADFDHPPYYNDAENDDNEQSSLMGPMEIRPVAEGPPPPPKTRTSRALPQTVSFADFDVSIPSGFSAGPRGPHLNTHILTGILRPSTPKSPRDINKPLPPPPTEQPRSEGAPAVPGKDILPAQPSQYYFLANADTVQTRKPPPPPASRRAGKAQGRPRNMSSLTQSSIADEEQYEMTPVVLSLSPSHSVQPVQNLPSPTVEVPAQVLPPNQTPVGSKPAPPPPPRRSMTSTGSSAERTPSNASRSSLARTDSGQTTTSSGSAPPVPPPRRAGGSKRNSLDEPLHLPGRAALSSDFRRSSGQSFGSDRSTSISHLQQVTEPGEVGEAAGSSISDREPTNNILADLTAFQAEIEALRAQAAIGG